PVTECVTGLDLVAWQLAIAAGEPIPLQQEDIAITGHAIEARVYAEDPEHDFLPASGRLDFLALPEGDGIRIDSGVAAGDRIGVFYDPMLMKVIARAPTREEAIHNLREALTGLEVAGIRTNRDFLIALLAHEPFIVSPLSTDYLDLHLGKLFHGPGDNEYRHLLSAAALHLLEPPRNGYSVWHDAPNFRLNQTTGTRLRLFCQGRIEEVEIAFDQDVACFSLADHSWRVRSVDVGILEIGGETQRYHVVRESEKLTVFGATRTLEFHLPREQDAASEDTGNVKAPMSGKIIAISVSVGERVEAGASLAVMEAMKMEHTLRAPADGTVKAVHFAPGDIVDEGSEILEIEESGE
ncbi:MAG: 3-methylcrotonyl-CoA carboxylase, partial [Pseudomonadales bacterium]|nr:3-methylcrotonyl-CoA carboxylase [Pseudomonadales bacterium]